MSYEQIAANAHAAAEGALRAWLAGEDPETRLRIRDEMLVGDTTVFAKVVGPDMVFVLDGATKVTLGRTERVLLMRRQADPSDS